MPRARPALVLTALWALSFTTSVQFLVVVPILPRIAEQLHVPERQLGWLITSYALAFGVCALIAGPVSDWVGRRRILLYGSLGMTFALGLHVAATTLPSLLLVRALAGVMSGVLSGATVAFIGDWFPYDQRGRANGWIASAMAAGQILGIPIGAALAEDGYQLPFVVLAAVGVVATLLVARFVPEPDVELASELSLSSALQGYATLLRNPHARGAIASYVVMFSGISVFITYLPAWLEHRFDATGADVGRVFMIGGLSNLAMGPVAGALSDRVGRKILVVVGSVLNGLVMMATPVLVWRFEAAYVLFFVVMIFVALRVSPQQSLVSSLVPARQRGTLLSLCFALGQVGFAVGALVAGELYASSWGFPANAFAGGAAAVATAGIVALLLPEPSADGVSVAAPTPRKDAADVTGTSAAPER